MNKILKLRIIEKFDTQSRFAAALDMSESYVSRVLHGHRRLSPKEQDRWAAVLNTTPEALGLRVYAEQDRAGEA